MTIHAVDKNMSMENVVIEYRDRPEGSESKLNTYSDGFKVLGTIIRLFRNYRPFQFFGIVALVLAVVSILFAIPVFVEFIETGEVPRFPTLIVCGFVMMAAIQSLFSGMLLETIVQRNRQEFELELYKVEHRRRKKTES